MGSLSLSNVIYHITLERRRYLMCCYQLGNNILMQFMVASRALPACEERPTNIKPEIPDFLIAAKWIIVILRRAFACGYDIFNTTLCRVSASHAITDFLVWFLSLFFALDCLLRSIRDISHLTISASDVKFIFINVT